MKSSTHVVGVVGNGGPREDSVLIHLARSAAVGGGGANAFGVVIESRDDVTRWRRLEIRVFLAGNIGFDLRLDHSACWLVAV